MGFDNQNAARIVFDVETAPLPEAAEYLEPATAPANYKDPEKIAAYIAEANAVALSKCSLDVDLCRVVAIGYQIEGDPEPQAVLATGGAGWSEDGLIRAFWAVSAAHHLVGFNCLDFDLPVLLRRSLYLGVPTPLISLDKYRHPQVTDLMQEFCFNGKLRARSLAFYVKRFGIAVADPMTGADVAQAVAESRWRDVEAHVRADVEKTVRLAARLGYFRLALVAA